MENFANNTQLEELAAFMASQINVPTIGIGGGYAPIGTINFFDATVAPQDWLACDGSVYNIADYPQLAEWYATQHGAANYYGGDGTTTFAVPDLQGEFLRGTGTNSHTNQGSGAALGVHQDGTIEHEVRGYNGNMYMADIGSSLDYNYDSYVEALNFLRASSVTSQSGAYTFTSRPTNTSFLICVKAVVAGEVYSTEERVVGTWIDGKPLYQKTLPFTVAPINTWTSYFGTLPNGEVAFVDSFLVFFNGSPTKILNNFSDFQFAFDESGSDLKIKTCCISNNSNYNGKQAHVTISYTKTTD